MNILVLGITIRRIYLQVLIIPLNIINVDLSTMDTKKFHWELYPMKFFKNVDTVFHLAATPQVQYSIENPTDNNNLDSLINLISLIHLFLGLYGLFYKW